MTAGAIAALFVLVAAGVVRVAHRRTRAARTVSRLRPGAAVGWGALVDACPPPPKWFTATLADAGVERIDPAVAFSVAIATTSVGACTAGILAGPVIGVVAAGACVVAGFGARQLLSGRGARAYEASLPHALDLVARSLRSGASLHQAIDETSTTTDGRVALDLRSVADAVRLGVPLVAAIDRWASERALPGVHLAAAALCLGAEAGGAQARAIDGVAATLRERAALAGEVRALTSQARTSAVVIAVAPVVFCAVTTATDARNAEFLFRTPLGVALLLAGLGLDGAAVVWMHALTRRVGA